MKFIKKINFKNFSILLIPIFGLLTIFPLFLDINSFAKRFNLFTTYDNALDNSLALGIAPDYDTTSSAGNLKYGEYLEPFNINNKITKYENISIMDGQEVNKIPIENLKVETIVLNEWMKADEPKFANIVNNVAYTSMGDSRNATHNESMIIGGWDYKTQVSVEKAFRMQAKDLDKIYLGNNFEEKANQILSQDKERIRYLNEKNINKLNKISIGIIRGANEKSEIDTKFSFYNPAVYPFFYSPDPNKGIGLDFPEPINKDFINSTHYKIYEIKAASSSTLLTQFEKKFDYLVYLTPDMATYEKKDVLDSQIKSLLKDQSGLENKIEFAKSGKWYTSAWGIIGKRELISYMIAFLKKNNLQIIDNPDLIWDVPKDFKRLRNE